MYYVYILCSETNSSYYKGQTSNLAIRLQEHNAGKEIATRRYRPWKLVWYTVKNTRSEALELERKLKNITSRKRLQAFIEKYAEDRGGPDVPA
jgi:putative endonuclease